MPLAEGVAFPCPTTNKKHEKFQKNLDEEVPLA